MVPAPLPLPERFPCWCRAVYSWGGESKRDLGFIEGDLIECLNAGDGSWWVGRLYRDRRTVGSFPSNFVAVLPPEFRPSTRSVSPLPPSNTPSPKNLAKSKPFRRPFEAYAKAPHYTSAKVPVTFREDPKAKPNDKPPVARTRTINNAREHTPPTSQSRNHGSRAPSPAPTFPEPRVQHRDDYEQLDSYDSPNSTPPPAPPPHKHVQRVDSGTMCLDAEGVTREASKLAQTHHHPISRHASLVTYDEQPPHSRHASQLQYQDDSFHTRRDAYHTPRKSSSYDYSSTEHQMTPSPLRAAMNGVMEQLGELEGLTTSRMAESSDAELDPWAPESFDMGSYKPRKQGHNLQRPRTSLGINQSDEGYETWSGTSSEATSSRQRRNQPTQELPHLSNYVERMERRFQAMHQNSSDVAAAIDEDDLPPLPPPKNQLYSRPKSSAADSSDPGRQLRSQKSAFEVRGVGRSGTTKTTVTNVSTSNQSNTSASTQSSGHTLWSGVSAGGFSSTSAGSMARTHHVRAHSAMDNRDADPERPESPFTGVTYHSSHASNAGGVTHTTMQGSFDDTSAGLGGLVQPKAPKRNIFKKIFETAKTGVASNRGSIAGGSISGNETARSSPFSRSMGAASTVVSTGISGSGTSQLGRNAAKEMGLGGGVDWVQVRRDVNRSNSLSKNEKAERRDRCQMQDHPALNPVDELFESIEGDEGADGNPVHDPVNYHSINLSQVDKNSRFVSDPPPMTTAMSLATTYVARPYRSDVQKLRAIFTWVSEKICWEDDFEGEINTREVIQSKRGCSEEYAVLVMEMCIAVGLHCEVVRGYLKSPGDAVDLSIVPRSNNWWNAVLVDDEWRMMDCCLASPSNPKRGHYSSSGNTVADTWWFLTKPSELCWTHVPEHHDQQHIVPPVAHEILLSLPCACPTFFRNGIEMVDYNTSSTRIEDLEMTHIKINVPADIEVVAEVEARAYARDCDGDVFESGDMLKKRALAQAEWHDGVKRYTIKALLPGDEGQGTLKIYAGIRGLMHSIKDIPHALALALPIVHCGENPPYEFVTRHPTPHAQRNDIYVVQPQCQRLALNNTFVFAVRQHPSSISDSHQSILTPSSNPGATSPVPFMRPGSAMSMNGSSVSSSKPSSASGVVAGKKPAKLAIQTPGGKILRLSRKEDRRGISVTGRSGEDDDVSSGATWETIIKCSEKGVWRGLVLADRTARWCVFAEWVCVG